MTTTDRFEGALSEQRLLVQVLGELHQRRLEGLLRVEVPGLPTLEIHVRGAMVRSAAAKPETEVRRIAAMGQGRYTLADAPPAGESTTPLLTLVLAAARSIPDIESVREALGNLDASLSITPSGSRGLADGAGLSAQEGYLLTRFDGSVGIRQLAQISPAGEEETLRTMLGLVAAGYLGPATAQAETVTRTIAPRPAADAEPGQGPAPVPANVPPPAATVKTQASEEDRMAKLRGFLQRTQVSDSGQAAASAPEQRPSSRRAATRPPAEPRRPAVPRKAMPTEAMAGAPKVGTTDGTDRLSLLGRLRTSESQNYYELLEVESGSSEGNIRESYYSLARRFHPDRFHTPDVIDLQQAMEILFGRINQAFRTLMNQEKRAEYDREMQQGNQDQGKVQKKAAQEVGRENFRRGQKLLAAGQMVKALPFFENAVRADQSCAEYYETLGLLQSLNPRLKAEAEATLKQAIKLTPSRASGYLRLGLFYLKTNQLPKASAALQKAMTWDPTDAMARMALGKLKAGGQGVTKDAAWLIKQLLTNPSAGSDE